jgi:hypothetical protein
VQSLDVCLQFAQWYRYHYFKGLMASEVDLADSPADDLFVLGRNQIVYDQTLQAFDVVSAVLAPVGLDFVGDAFGAIYAGYYGDAVNAAIYGGAILIPLSNAAVFREVVTGIKQLKKVDGQYKIMLKAKTLPTGLPARFSEKFPPDLLLKLQADESAGLVSKINSVNLTDNQLKELGSLLNGSDEVFDLFRGNEGLVEG